MKKNIGKILVFILLVGLLAGLSTTALAANKKLNLGYTGSRKLNFEYTGSLKSFEKKKVSLHLGMSAGVTVDITCYSPYKIYVWRFDE